MIENLAQTRVPQIIRLGADGLPTAEGGPADGRTAHVLIFLKIMRLTRRTRRKPENNRTTGGSAIPGNSSELGVPSNLPRRRTPSYMGKGKKKRGKLRKQRTQGNVTHIASKLNLFENQ